MTRRGHMIPGPELRRLTQKIVELQKRIGTLEKAGRSTQLSNSSIEGGYLTIRDANGQPRGYLGMQPDGNSDFKPVNNPPPSRPNTPELVPIMAGVALTWNGDLVDGPPKPTNFSHINAYLSGAGPDFIHGPSNLVGTLTRAGSIPVAPLPAAPYWARFIAYNKDDPTDESEPSLTAGPVTPEQVVAQGLLDGVVTEVKLAQDAVTEAKLAAGAVTETKVADDAISTPKLVAGAVQTEKIAAGAVAAEKIAAGAVTAEKISALAVTADKVDANAIQAGHLTAGAVTAEKLESNLVIAGDPTGDRVQINQANGIEQWLDGERTLWIPPVGDAEFRGMLTSGTSAQFIRLEPRGASAGPRLLMRDDVGSRQVSLFFADDNMWFYRETAGDGLGKLRGGHLQFAPSVTALSHRSDVASPGEDGEAKAFLNLSDIAVLGSSGQISVNANGGTAFVTASNQIQIAADETIFIDSGPDHVIYIHGGTDLFLSNESGAELRLAPDGGVYANGAAVKSFIIPHPTDDDRWLVHGCTESPTAGVEYWGEAEIVDGVADVPLPGYFEALTLPDRQVWVSVMIPDDLNEWLQRPPPAQRAKRTAAVASPEPPGREARSGSSSGERSRPSEEWLRRRDERPPAVATTTTPTIPRAAASPPRDGTFRIICDGPDGTRVAWLVKAARKDAPFEVEPLRADIEVHGDGPYRYFIPTAP